MFLQLFQLEIATFIKREEGIVGHLPVEPLVVDEVGTVSAPELTISEQQFKGKLRVSLMQNLTTFSGKPSDGLLKNKELSRFLGKTGRYFSLSSLTNLH